MGQFLPKSMHKHNKAMSKPITNERIGKIPVRAHPKPPSNKPATTTIVKNPEGIALPRPKPLKIE
ncbi:hypothetical protein EX84_15665 [Staphylococcus aureus]|nr:hypothetical protein EX84_15665 [Staphylococcus aureus]